MWKVYVLYVNCREPFVMWQLAVLTAITVSRKVEEMGVKKLAVILWQDEGKCYK
jgi:hypothetical protein